MRLVNNQPNESPKGLKALIPSVVFVLGIAGALGLGLYCKNKEKNDEYKKYYNHFYFKYADKNKDGLISYDEKAKFDEELFKGVARKYNVIWDGKMDLFDDYVVYPKYKYKNGETVEFETISKCSNG